MIGFIVAATAVEGWSARPHAKAEIGLKISIVLCIPLGSGLMAVVSPRRTYSHVGQSKSPSLLLHEFAESRTH